ncbi:MAG TPA: type II toxin-antitoxin system HicB family antitoxin [Chitinophagaceae bacterium]|nr:type II toxin-antitoxin system HicB family antitoxin [Chitinophagaceae bacterium]
MINRYEIIIYWSATDNAFIAEIPELKGCVAHGDTQDEALREVNIVAFEWIKIAKEKGWQIPEPKGRLVFA